MTQTYISPSKTFSFEYPDNWKLDKKDGTIVLYKKGGFFKKSSNILRITPLLSEQNISTEAYAALINLRKKEYPDLEIIEKFDNDNLIFHVLKYSIKDSQSKEGKSPAQIQNYWELVINNRIFTCLFSSPLSEDGSAEVKEDREAAESIVSSLKLL